MNRAPSDRDSIPSAARVTLPIMPRQDLLALSPDDLASLSNRGTVKRALRELESGTLTYEIREGDDGAILVTWSDGIDCRFPAEAAVDAAICSSGGTGLTRHVVRSVLAYQRHHMGESPSANAGIAAEAEAVRHAVWDPGAITDEQLKAHFRKTAVTRARQRYARGVLVELVRSEKPWARFLDEPCMVRFLVPGDLRYIQADCAETALPLLACCAVWAFRELHAEADSGLVSVQPERLEVPTELLDTVEQLFQELVLDGVSRCAAQWEQKLVRAEEDCRDHDLIWPAEILHDVLEQFGLYRRHDALFDPQRIPQLIGEFLIRADAIRSQNDAVPQPLVRGVRSDQAAELNGGRFLGIGCGVRVARGRCTIAAHLQNLDSGSVAIVSREFADPSGDMGQAPRNFSTLARTSVGRRVTLSGLATGQLLLKRAKQTAAHELKLPRTAASMTLNPQTFQWEALRAPLLLDGFAEITARLRTLPPSSLRPRRTTENLHVCAIESVDAVEFDVVQQRLEARLRDDHGAPAEMIHPFHERGAAGFERLRLALTQASDHLRFLAGHVTLVRKQLRWHPVTLVFESNGKRSAVQPWIDAAAEGQDAASPAAEFPASVATAADVAFREEWQAALADSCLLGLSQIPLRAASAWRDVTENAARIGCIRLIQPLERFQSLLAQKSETRNWDSAAAARQLLELCVLARMADDVSG